MANAIYVTASQVRNDLEELILHIRTIKMPDTFETSDTFEIIPKQPKTGLLTKEEKGENARRRYYLKKGFSEPPAKKTAGEMREYKRNKNQEERYRTPADLAHYREYQRAYQSSYREKKRLQELSK